MAQCCSRKPCNSNLPLANRSAKTDEFVPYSMVSHVCFSVSLYVFINLPACLYIFISLSCIYLPCWFFLVSPSSLIILHVFPSPCYHYVFPHFPAFSFLTPSPPPCVPPFFLLACLSSSLPCPSCPSLCSFPKTAFSPLTLLSRPPPLPSFHFSFIPAPTLFLQDLSCYLPLFFCFVSARLRTSANAHRTQSQGSEQASL